MTRTKRLKNVFVTAGTTLAAALIITSASLAFAADTTPPSTPTGLSASAVSLSQINLSWTASTDDVGVAGYGVFRNGLQVGTTTAISYSDSGLAAGTSYSYAVDAFDAAGNLSTQSASVSTSTLSDTTAPSVPTSLVATPVSASQINLSWSASTDNVGVTGYKVYRNGVQVGTTAATSYSDTGLAASTGYSYTVAAYDAASNTSAQSGSVSATTLTSTSTDTTAPTVPSSIIATPISASQINLSWTASTDNVGVTGYTVYRNGMSVGSPVGNSFSDTGLAASTAYAYTVSAHDAAGNASAQSGSISASTLASGTTASSVSVPPTVDISSNGSITIHGLTVTSVGTNTFTGTVWGITYTVNYNGTATTGNGRGRFQFLLRGGNNAAVNASQIQVGDIVGVQGTVTQASPTVITAQVVRNYSITTPRMPNPIGNRGTYNGDVSSSTGVNGNYNLGNIQSLFEQLMNQFKSFKGGAGKNK